MHLEELFNAFKPAQCPTKLNLHSGILWDSVDSVPDWFREKDIKQETNIAITSAPIATHSSS